MNKKKYTGHLITHTHWDREWYQPVEIYRFRLIELFERLKYIFSTDNSYHSFFFDGQTIPIDDYLEARKDDEGIIAEYIKDGKVRIGPFYVLLDEQLVSGESYVRNLMIGMSAVCKYGGAPPIGYLPDNFGHTSQTPQILTSFGIDNAVMWRGYEVDDDTPSEVWWEGADGTKIKALLLLCGYSSFAGADSNDTDTFQRAFDSLRKLKKHARSDNLLFMHGIDHSLPHPRINEIIKLINEYDDEVETSHSDLHTYINAIPWENVDYNLKGELIKAPQLDGTFSSRLHLKQMNRKCENELSYYAEPLATLAWLNGNEYPAEDLLRAWKYLIKCHPHDSITGCNSDRVAEDMEIRFSRSYEMAAYLSSRAFDHLTGERFDFQNPADSKFISVFNPMPVERNEVIRAELFLPVDVDPIRNISILQDGHWFRANVISHDEICWPMRSEYMIPKRIVHKRLTIEFGPVKLPPFSIANFKYEVKVDSERADNLMDAVTVDPARSLRKSAPICKRGNILENKFYIVEIQPDATINVTVKDTGKTYERIHVIEAEIDAGNLYNFAPLINGEKHYLSPGSFILEQNFDTSASIKLTGSLEVPAGISQTMKPLEQQLICPIAVTITLKKDDPIVYFRTSIENKAKNICVRTVFESDIDNAVNYVHTPFDIQKREALADEYMEVGERRISTGISRYCAHYFTSVSDDKNGLTLLNKGLPEYTFHDNGILTLTLLRSSNIIWGTTKKDFPLKEYPAEAGFELGFHEREYGLLLHKGHIVDSNMLSKAFAYNMPAFSKVYSQKTTLPFSLNLGSDTLILSAFKKSEDQLGIILRFYNILNAKQTARINLPATLEKVFRCRVDETTLKEIPLTDTILNVVAQPKEIVTLKLIMERSK